MVSKRRPAEPKSTWKPLITEHGDATMDLFTTEAWDWLVKHTVYPTANPHVGKYRLVKSAWLGSPTVPGADDRAWYLLADPQVLPVIEVAFLHGQEQPTIEQAEADFNVLGIQMRGFHDFGCKKQDLRGAIKMAGR